MGLTDYDGINDLDARLRYEEKVRVYDFLDNIDDSDERDSELEQTMATLKRKRTSPSQSRDPRQTTTRRATAISDKIQALNRATSAPVASTETHTNVSLPSSAGSRSVSDLSRATIPGPSIVTGSLTRATTYISHDTTTQHGERGLFGGCHFYFFPNNDNHPGRKFRIKKAEEYGAVRELKWSVGITHLVVDRSMTYDQVRPYLKISEGLEDIPAHVHVVTEDFPAECIAYQKLLDPRQQKYRVKGFVPPVDPRIAQRHVTAKHQKPASLELKPAGKDVQTKPLQTPSQSTAATAASGASSDQPVLGTSVGRVEDHEPKESVSDEAAHAPNSPNSHGGPIKKYDELDRAISEARQAYELLLDEDDDENPLPTGGSGEDRMTTATNVPRWQGNFQCMRKNSAQTSDGPNAATIAILQEMAEYYTKIQDTWRPIAYRKAISTLRNHPLKVVTADQAEALPFIGSRLALKIEEIVCTNALRRLESAKAEPTDQILQLFLGVYGIGFNQGMKFLAQGFKTLDDLEQKATLTDNMRIGIRHYADFNSRIDRAEVRAHSEVIRAAAGRIDPDIEIHTMGSYRRGASSSGDIDLIITHPTWTTARLRDMLMTSLVPALFEMNFLQCTLAATNRLDGTKWHGASRLPEQGAVWRRIDLLLVPAAELGAALIYFTGNDIFNRSLRLLASRKHMRLNQRGLYKDVMRAQRREKMTAGTLVEGASERGIFDALGVPWRPPHERIC